MGQVRQKRKIWVRKGKVLVTPKMKSGKWGKSWCNFRDFNNLQKKVQVAAAQSIMSHDLYEVREPDTKVAFPAGKRISSPHLYTKRRRRPFSFHFLYSLSCSLAGRGWQIDTNGGSYFNIKLLLAVAIVCGVLGRRSERERELFLS